MPQEIFDDEVKQALEKMVKENTEAEIENIYKLTNKVFKKEQVVLEKVDDERATISVLSSDQDFAKKEFGADEYHPANRLIQLKDELSKKTK